VTFTATATVGSPATISLTSGNNQSGQISTALATPFIVTVTDAGAIRFGRECDICHRDDAGGSWGTGAEHYDDRDRRIRSRRQHADAGRQSGIVHSDRHLRVAGGSPVTFTATASTGGLTHFTVEQTGGGIVGSETAGLHSASGSQRRMPGAIL